MGDLDDIFRDQSRILNTFMCNHYREAIGGCEAKLSEHHYYHTMRAIMLSVNGLITFEYVSSRTDFKVFDFFIHRKQ